MALNASKVQSGGGKKAELLSPENYMGRIVQILDMGLQPQRPYEGKVKEPAQMLRVTYELSTEFMKDDEGNDLADKPRWISEKFVLFNLGADRATSTLRYKNLDPTEEYGGDWAQLLGAPCLIAIVNNENKGKMYNNVGAVSPPIKGIPVPELVSPATMFDMDDPDMEVFESLPDFIKDDMTSNLNFKGSALEAAISGEDAPVPTKDDADPAPLDDDLPL